jgi:hypothetical protein
VVHEGTNLGLQRVALRQQLLVKSSNHGVERRVGLAGGDDPLGG